MEEQRKDATASKPPSATNTGTPNRRHKGRHFHSRNAQGKPTGQGNSQTRVIGVKGLKVLSGRVAEEWLTALRYWRNEAKIYTEMRDDAIVGTLLDAIKLPLQSAAFDVLPGGQGTPADQEAADWLKANLEGMQKQSWTSHVEDAMEALDFGFAVGEIVLDKRSDGRLWLKNIDPRGQETLDHWGFSPEDAVETFFQQDPDTGTIIELPLSKCVHVSYRGRKGSPQGKSLLRSLFRPWKFAKYLEDLEGIGIERDIGGMPIARLTKDANMSDDDIDDLKLTMKALRKDEEMYLIEPEGVEIRAYSGGNKVYDVAAVIERKQKEILGRFFAQFLKLGMDKVGTQALVKGAQDFFYLDLISVQRYLLEAWNQQLVPYLFRFNQWAGLTAYPTITWEAPGKVDLMGIMDFINTAVGAKVWTPTDQDEDWLRSLADAPELPEEDRGMPRNPEQPPAFPGIFDLPKKVKALEDKAAAGVK